MKPPPNATLPAIDLLQSYGYQVRFQRQEWWTCAVLGPGTAALGHGVDEAAALDHALRQLLPGDLAKTLWTARLDQHSVESRAAAQAEGPHLAPSPGPQTEQQSEPTADAAVRGYEIAAAEPLEPVDSAVLAEVQPAPIHTPESADPSIAYKAYEEDPHVITSTLSVLDSSAERAPPPPALVAKTKVTAPPPPTATELAGIDRALSALQALEREVDETDDFPLLSAQMMQLQLVAWIAVARDWQDRKNDPEVTQRVSAFAARMARLARRYWPGQVAALRLEARPEECSGLVGGSPQSWAEVADFAVQAMVEPTGLDEYGWADATKLGPQPPDARSRLGEAQAMLRKLLPGADEPDGPAARRCLSELKAKPPVDEMAAIARKLRWLRLSADPEPWGRAMGWLRWLAQRLGPGVSPAMVALLQPETLPARDWAKDNGFQPQRGEVRKLVAELPAAPAPAAELLDWFKRAVSLMDAAELTERLRGHSATILLMDAHEWMPGKDNGTARDRLRKVQKRMTGPANAAALPPIPCAQEELLTDFAEASPVERARALVIGQRALVLGNRVDPHLERHLRQGLGLADLDWCLTDYSSGLDAAADRVRNHGYDIVLGLTSFISHSSEGVLRQACRSGSVPFIRAGKGRLVGCAVAILRDLGAPVQSPVLPT